MSRRGNDLCRRYLWMAALSALRYNPAVRALYARVVAKHPQHKAVAVGHAMRKLVHLVFAIAKSGRPFDPNHYPWPTPAHVPGSDNALSPQGPTSDNALSVNEQAAGLKPAQKPVRSEVTAAGTGSAVADDAVIDFAHLKQQLPLSRVLDQLGLTAKLRGRGAQRRGPCPLHRGDARGRTFSVNLDDHVFCCHAKGCGRHGDVLDLWAAVHGLSLRAAAVDLVNTFGLEPAPRPGTEKRNG
jgi:CHC2 zinc finger